MKVILTEDVYKHGVAGEVVDVANGFARNYLFPQGMAIKATPGSLKRMSKLRAEAENRRARRDGELQELAEKVEALTLAFPVKAGETGKLYGSVTNAHISEAIQEQLGIEIDRRRIGEQPLRELGQHSVAVRLSAALTPAVTVLVHREGEAPESVLDVVPTGEMEEEPTIFDEVMVEVEEESPAGDYTAFAEDALFAEVDSPAETGAMDEAAGDEAEADSEADTPEGD